MAKTYSYEPMNMTETGLDRMRFELGDTLTEGGGDTCALCDEEYQYVLSKNENWNQAKLECLHVMMMKFAYDVDYSVDKLHLSLSQRYPRWKQLYEELKKNAAVIPFSAIQGEGKELAKDNHYFTLGMLKNPFAL